jgi:hypothetical protein
MRTEAGTRWQERHFVNWVSNTFLSTIGAPVGKEEDRYSMSSIGDSRARIMASDWKRLVRAQSHIHRSAPPEANGIRFAYRR